MLIVVSKQQGWEMGGPTSSSSLPSSMASVLLAASKGFGPMRRRPLRLLLPRLAVLLARLLLEGLRGMMTLETEEVKGESSWDCPSPLRTCCGARGASSA